MMELSLSHLMNAPMWKCQRGLKGRSESLIEMYKVDFTHYLIEIRLTAQQIELMPVLVLGKSDHNCDLYPVNSFTFMYFTVCLVKVLPR